MTDTPTVAHPETPAGHHPQLQHHFSNMEQQREAGTLGMWIFLITEVMFFGGMFTAYIVYRSLYPGAFADASRHLDTMLGATNTAVLICSSFTMVLAVYGAQTGKRRMLISCIILTMLLGLVFLGIKGTEYHHKFVEHFVPGPSFSYPGTAPAQAQMFFTLYFAMTGLHALHMIIGLGIMTVMLIMSIRGKFTPEYHAPIEISGLYWHFVDIIWIFLFPLLYLLGLHMGGAHHG